MTLKERVQIYCQSKGISISHFERSAGLANGYFKEGSKTPREIKILQILRAFPDLNRNWFLFEEGPMLNTTPTLTTEETDPRSINPKKSPDMDIALALDFIGHLKEEVASLKEQLSVKDAQIEQLIHKLPKGGGF